MAGVVAVASAKVERVQVRASITPKATAVLICNMFISILSLGGLSVPTGFTDGLWDRSRLVHLATTHMTDCPRKVQVPCLLKKADKSGLRTPYTPAGS